MTASLTWTVVRIALFFVAWPMSAKIFGIPSQWVALLMIVFTAIGIFTYGGGSLSVATLPSNWVLAAYFAICLGNAWATLKYGQLTGDESVPLADVIVVQAVTCVMLAPICESLFITKAWPSVPKLGTYLMAVVTIYAMVKVR